MRTNSQVATGIGIVVHVLMVMPFIAIGLVIPGWAAACLFVIWGVGLLLALSVRRLSPWLVLVVPLATLAAIYLFLHLGERLGGWNA